MGLHSKDGAGRKKGCVKHPETGRKKGTPNKRSKYGSEVDKILTRLECCPFEGMALIGMRKVDCYVCNGTRVVVSFGGNPDANEPSDEEDCTHCAATGYEPIDPGVRTRAYSELAQYLAPKRKAIETTNTSLIGVVIKDYTGKNSGLVLESQESELIETDMIEIEVE